MIDSIEIDSDIVNVNWTSSRIGSSVTGFNMSVSSLGGEHKEVVVKTGGGSYTLGTENGVTSQLGTSESKINRGKITVVADPFSEFLSKLIMTYPSDGRFSAVSGVHTMTNSEFIANIQKMFFSGSLTLMGFIDAMTGCGEDPYFNLTVSKNLSPMVRALGSESDDEAVIKENIQSAYTNKSVPPSTMTVLGFFQNYIFPLGMEIYYLGGSNYELSSPKILLKEQGIIVDESSVISIASYTNPHSSPDVVIPSTEWNHGTTFASGEMSKLLAAQMKKITGSSRYFKTKIYKIPPIIHNVMTTKFLAGSRVDPTKSSADKSFQGDLAKVMSQFYGNLATSSSFDCIRTGSMMLDFSPEFDYGFRWITFRGENLFIGDVKHTLSRGGSTTTLFVIASGDIDLNVPSSSKGTTIKNKLIDEAKRFETKQKKKAQSEKKKIQKEIENKNKSLKEDVLRNTAKPEQGFLELKDLLPEWVKDWIISW